MSIPGLLHIPVESSDPNDKLELVNFQGEIFTMKEAHKRGNCRPMSDFEKICNIGEGSYGTVYKVRDKTTDKVYALKKLKICSETQMMPQNFLREITNLKLLKHENITNLIDIAVGERIESTCLILEFCKYSLAKVFDDDPTYGQQSKPKVIDDPTYFKVINVNQSFLKQPQINMVEDAKGYMQRPQIKNIMYQLFNGLYFIHTHGILHRDLNPANILFNEEATLKIADFGSSRKIFEGNLTPNIGTQWYCSPEILFGSTNYSVSTDIWSAGCIFAEMLRKEVLFPGNCAFHIIQLIHKLLGSPRQKDWPEYTQLPMFQDYDLKIQRFNKLKTEFIKETDATIQLIRNILVYNPSSRLSAKECLEHPYFSEKPKACSSEDLLRALQASQDI